MADARIELRTTEPAPQTSTSTWSQAADTHVHSTTRAILHRSACPVAVVPLSQP
jgi:hypothetical protein